MPAERVTSATGGRRAIGHALLAAALLGACGEPPGPVASSTTNEVREFSGRMTLSGSRQTLSLQGPRSASTFRLSGSALLSGADRPNLGFKAEIIGFSDTGTGMNARSVWTDERGDRAFSELHAQEAGPGKPVEGTFTGGTGRYAGLSGSYRFTWQYMTDAEDGSIGARITDLRGSVRLAPSARSSKESR